MARVYFTGFETGDFVECATSSGTVSISSTIKRSGDYALRCNPATTGAGSVRLRGVSSAGIANTSFALATIWARVYVRLETIPAALNERLLTVADSSANNKLYMHLQNDGALLVYDSVGTLLGTSTTLLTTGVWYCLEVKCGSHATDAAWEVRINGRSELSGTAALLAANVDRVILGKVVNTNGQSVDWYFDDVSFDDADWPGPGAIARRDVTAVGNHTAWTGDNTAVDDVPHNSDTDYATSATSGQVESAVCEASSAAGIGGLIRTVKTLAVVRDEGSASASVQVLMRSGSTDSYKTAVRPNTTYLALQNVQNTDPADSLGWTVAKLNSVEPGIKAAASYAVRCTALSVHAEYLLPPAGVTVRWEPDSTGTYGRLWVFWTADETGAISKRLDDVQALRLTGRPVRLVTVPSAQSPPTDDYDLTLTSVPGVDLLQGAGANRDTANIESSVIADVVDGSTQVGVRPVTIYDATFGVSGAGAGGQGTAVIEVALQRTDWY